MRSYQVDGSGGREFCRPARRAHGPPFRPADGDAGARREPGHWMYTPAPFAETRLPVLHDAIERKAFAVLTSVVEGRVRASHVPLFLDRHLGTHGTLKGHFSLQNYHWRAFEPTGKGAAEVLAVFVLDDAYISPSWYPEKKESGGRVVPTWN